MAEWSKALRLGKSLNLPRQALGRGYLAVAGKILVSLAENRCVTRANSNCHLRDICGL